MWLQNTAGVYVYLSQQHLVVRMSVTTTLPFSPPPKPWPALEFCLVTVFLFLTKVFWIVFCFFRCLAFLFWSDGHLCTHQFPSVSFLASILCILDSPVAGIRLPLPEKRVAGLNIIYIQRNQILHLLLCWAPLHLTGFFPHCRHSICAYLIGIWSLVWALPG